MAAKNFDPPVAHDAPPVEEWPAQACVEISADVFYPDHASGYARAQKICNGCDAVQECGTWALQTKQRFGVWGGMTPDQRLALTG